MRCYRRYDAMLGMERDQTALYTEKCHKKFYEKQEIALWDLANPSALQSWAKCHKALTITILITILTDIHVVTTYMNILHRTLQEIPKILRKRNTNAQTELNGIK